MKEKISAGGDLKDHGAVWSSGAERRVAQSAKLKMVRIYVFSSDVMGKCRWDAPITRDLGDDSRVRLATLSAANVEPNDD
jgi:hypothetical protein